MAQPSSQVFDCLRCTWGTPRNWRQFAGDQLGGDLPEPKNGSDETWRHDFVAYRIERLLKSESDRYFDRSFTTLSAEARIIANELGRYPGGVRWDRITGLFGHQKEQAAEKAQRGINVLWDHLGIVEPTVQPTGRRLRGNVKIRLIVHAAMFELAVLPHFPVGGEAADGEPLKKAMDVMSTVEGFALEQLTKEWLRWFPQLDWVVRSAVMKQEGGQQFEIGVAGETRDPDAQKRCLALCSCKRNREQHNDYKTKKEFERYREIRAKERRTWEDRNIRWLLVSPEWPADKPRNDRFMRMDFSGMAANLSLRPKPWPLPIPEQPGPGRSMEPLCEPDGNSPDFSM